MSPRTSPPGDTIDARALLPDDPAIPPVLYVSPEAGEAALDMMLSVLELSGLPRLAVTGDTLNVRAAVGKAWRVEIGPGRSVVAWTAFPRMRGMGEERLVYEVTITDPPDWCEVAERGGGCLLIVGAAFPFRRGVTNFGQLIHGIDRGRTLAGLVPVVMTS